MRLPTAGLLFRRRFTELPDRIRAAIQHEQDRGEILIGWMQAGVVAMFAMLYAISPKTFSRSVTFEPVPWALAAYALFTLARLALAYRTRLPGWFLALSVVVDMALLLGLIWTFHLQYMQPPSFYLKAPTVLYLFLFIALRALRFEARYVLLAGGVAALGWLAMVGYAVSDGSSVTRNYVQDLTSNSVLLGAEFDKVVSILVVTGILAVALTRARGLLERAVAEGVAAQDLSRFFAPEVARRIRLSEQAIQAGEGQVRDAAVLFLDIRGFTSIAASMPPSAVMRLLAEYQARLVPLIRAQGGSIDKFLGDGILASFGAATPSATYAADGLRALQAAIGAVAAWNDERAHAGKTSVVVNGAVACGRILFGALGDATQLEYTVIGDTVNLAAKLEKHNKAAGAAALTTAECYDLACRQGFQGGGRPLNGERVAGLDTPVDLVALVSNGPS